MGATTAGARATNVDSVPANFKVRQYRERNMKRADPASALTIPIIGFMRARLLAVTNRLAVLSFAVVAAGMFSQHVFAQNPCDCWIDAKTGLPVPTVPERLTMVESEAATATGEAHTANGLNTVRLPDGTWIDAKNGQCVPTVPERLTMVEKEAATATGEAHTANGLDTVRVPCPPKSQPATAAPPDGTQPQTGSPTAPPETPVQQ